MAKISAEQDGLDHRDQNRSRIDGGMVRAKKSGGGKLSRSETVTVRLDPKLNHLCELAARAQRRTKSSFIEWAIENALTSVGIPGERKNAAGDLWTISDRNAELWDVDEPDRLVALSFFAPSLLTHEEQLIWKIIATSGFFWKGQYYDDADEEVWRWDTDSRWNLVMDRIREHWAIILSVASGESMRDQHYMLRQRMVRGKQVSSTPVTTRSFDTDLDDDVPF